MKQLIRSHIFLYLAELEDGSSCHCLIVLFATLAKHKSASSLSQLTAQCKCKLFLFFWFLGKKDYAVWTGSLPVKMENSRERLTIQHLRATYKKATCICERVISLWLRKAQVKPCMVGCMIFTHCLGKQRTYELALAEITNIAGITPFKQLFVLLQHVGPALEQNNNHSDLKWKRVQVFTGKCVHTYMLYLCTTWITLLSWL